MGRGGAVAEAWIFCGDEPRSRRRRSSSAEAGSPGRGAASSSLRKSGAPQAVIYAPLAFVCCIRYLRDLSFLSVAASALYGLGVTGALAYCCARISKKGGVSRPADDATFVDVVAAAATFIYACEAGRRTKRRGAFPMPCS